MMLLDRMWLAKPLACNVFVETIDEDELKDMIAAYLSEHGDDEADAERIIACLKQAAESRVVE